MAAFRRERYALFRDICRMNHAELLAEAAWATPRPPRAETLTPRSHRLRARPLAMGAPRELELSDEVEGEKDRTTDFVFRLAGDPIPLLPTDSNPLPLFDLLSPPARPLAVSDRHATVFLAHPSGFIAVRTKDLIEASKEAREKGTRCAQDCCVADVPLPGVSLIALSHDESVLAA